MEYKDYYAILGVSRTASQEEIRKAYRRLAMQYHPDRNPGNRQAEERFKEVNEAYQVLSDPQKRAHYDRLGESYARWQSGGGHPGEFNWADWMSGGGFEFDGQDLFSEFFRAIFGGMGGMGEAMPGRGRRRAAGAAQAQTTLTLREAFEGTTRQVQVDGRRLEVRIPPGVRTGSKVRVAGAGPVGPDGHATDLYLIVQVTEDPHFRREGDDLHTETPVDVFTLMLGGETEVQTLTGKVLLSIPAGTQSDQVFRLAGRGMPRLKEPGTRGDLYVRVKAQIPRQLTAQQRALIEQAARIKSR